jgi:3-hydroxymyristoyl/3-hydroxydecanoyl-(acyl carrier protein) dehydratase/malonyl CoA-acyl carrier protein transacylase
VLVLERQSDALAAGRPAIAMLDGAPASPPDLVIGDEDTAARFGAAHAAHGLVAVATAAVAVQHRALPRPDGPARAAPAGLVCRVGVNPLGADPASVTLRPGGPAPPWIAGPAPRMRVFSGADRAEVLSALASERPAAPDAGPARLVMLVEPGAEHDRAAAARRWLAGGGPRPDGVAYRDRPVGGEVAFVFTGGAASYPDMGAGLALAFPHHARAVERRATPPNAADGSGVLEKIWGAALLGGLHTEITRNVLGLHPAAAIGYSSGESTAFGALGAWHDGAAMLRDLRDSDLFRSGLTGEYRVLRQAWQGDRGRPGSRWASYLVGAPAERVRAALSGAVTVHLMMINAPRSCVIGGEEAECAAVLGRLDGVPAVPLDYPIAAHVPELSAVAEPYRRLHLRPTQDVPGIRFYSGATGEAYRVTAERAADAILAQAVGTVDFVRVIERAYADGVRVFIEHGPQALCTGWIRQILAGRDHVAVALDAPGGRAIRQLCQAVAELMAAGTGVRAPALLDHLAEAEDRRRSRGETITLPAHPPAMRLPGRDEPAVLPRAPELPAPPPPPRADPPPTEPPAPPPPGLPAPPNGAGRIAGDVFARVSAAHRDFLAQQAGAHLQFLEARWRGLSTLAASARTALARARRPVFDRSALERLAQGHLAEVFGPRFAALTGRRRLTRLPTPPLLLVDRVTGLDADPASMSTGTVRTETDVAPGAWYLDAAGRMPAGLMVEAGQADLLLISWLGVDLLDHGDRVYRLLGCELTYHGSPAAAGETLRYDIHVDRHAEHDGVRLFFFHYDCYAGDRLRMTIRSGQAGFFTDEELADSGGLQWTPADDPPGEPPPAPPVAMPARRRFDSGAVRAFAEGRPADCFGPAWTPTRAHVRSPRIDTGRLLLLGSITDLDPAGGLWGRGYLRGETPVTPDDWYFDGHFMNDPCMPGTLMYQGALQAMAFYLAALGHTIERDGWRFEPVPGEPTVLRCRGQVAPGSRRIEYEVFVRGLATAPYPTLYADVLGTVDGVKAFHARRAALRLVPDWPLPLPARPAEPGGAATVGAATVGGVVQDRDALLACAQGPMVRAMGPAYAGFDVTGRRAPRLPGPPYHFISRIVGVDGEFGAMRTGTTVTAEYDVPADAWYFAQNGAATMPLAVLMEVVLQPCGWLAMYLGSVLETEETLLFRNLDGTGTVRHEVVPGTGTLSTRVEAREISRYGNMIIESFSVTCTAGGVPVFELETVFGLFPPAAFADQPGLPPTETAATDPTASDPAGPGRPGVRAVDLAARPDRYFAGTARLPGPMLGMLDRITGYEPGGGSRGLGWLRAEKDVDAGDWYFKAHFFQDPVQPGSLGVQAICSLLQWYLIERDAGAGRPGARFESIRTGHAVTWKYRGQVVPTDTRLTIEIDVTGYGADEDGPYATADGRLWVDGRAIYQVTGLGVRILSGR